MKAKISDIEIAKKAGVKTYEYVSVTQKSGEDYSSMNTKNCPLSYNSYDISHFKYREKYMLGVQFCDKYGYWSDAIEIGQKNMDQSPENDVEQKKIVDSYFYTILRKNQDIIPEDAVAVRPVIIFPEGSERKILAQGVINPTIFDVIDKNNIYSSEFYRPIVELSEGEKLCLQPLLNDSDWPLTDAEKLKSPIHQYCKTEATEMALM